MLDSTLVPRIDAIATGTDADDWVARCDALLIEVGHIALRPGAEAVALIPGLDRLTPVLADRLRADAWQQRTHALNLAQLHAAVGEPIDGAKGWLRVAELVEHRRHEALGNARALFIRAGAYRAWLETQGERLPKDAGRIVQLLEARIRGTTDGILFTIEGLRWEELAAAVKEKLAPKAAPFVKAFPDDDFQPPVFSGVLSLGTVGGLFIDGVVARETPKAKTLLAQAADVRRAAGSVRAVWATPVSDAAELPATKASTATLSKKHAAFVKRVDALLGDCLEERRSDVRRFEGAPRAVISELGEALGDAFLDQGHNEAPSPRELLEHAPASATFDGHVVYPPRKDFRVGVVAVTLPTSGAPRGWKQSADEVVAKGKSTYLWWD